MTVFSIMGDLSLRPKWQEGVKAIDEISHPIYHMGVKHRCILDRGTRNIYVSSFSLANDAISLSETDEKKVASLYITLKAVSDDKALITFDLYIRKNLFMQMAFSLFMKKKLERSLRISIDNLEVLSTERKE